MKLILECSFFSAWVFIEKGRKSRHSFQGDVPFVHTQGSIPSPAKCWGPMKVQKENAKGRGKKRWRTSPPQNQGLAQGLGAWERKR